MRTLWDYIIMLIGTIGGFASIVTLLTLFNELTTEGWIAVLFMGVISIYFIIYNCWLISIYRKKSKYADMYSEINIGFSHLHQLRRIQDIEIKQITKELTTLCNCVSNAFVRLYGSNIGVCIKFIVNDKGRPRCETLTRDELSQTISRKTGENDKIPHWIDGNSDFEFIYSNLEDDSVDTSFYLEKHLPNCMDYKNTRLKQGWVPKTHWFYPQKLARKRNWPLRYKSTLVVPIVPLMANSQSQEAIRGFLCVDSSHEGIFNKDYDVDIMKGIADGIYNQIDLIYRLNKERLKNEK